jgi:hypothetical protein
MKTATTARKRGCKLFLKMKKKNLTHPYSLYGALLTALLTAYFFVDLTACLTADVTAALNRLDPRLHLLAPTTQPAAPAYLFSPEKIRRSSLLLLVCRSLPSCYSCCSSSLLAPPDFSSLGRSSSLVFRPSATTRSFCLIQFQSEDLRHQSDFFLSCSSCSWCCWWLYHVLSSCCWCLDYY